MPEIITEATSAIVEKKAAGGKPGSLLIGLISPGQGSSGFYSKECLEAASKDKVFPKGTHMYLDHPTESENIERPERSLRDLTAVLAEDATWNPDLGTLVAEAEVFGPYAESLVAMKDHIGVSIRASAEVEETPTGRQITRLVSAESVDFVTKAGRGGSILSVLESARPRVNARAVAHGVSESTVNDRREALAELLRETYGDKTPENRIWVYLRDFDDDVAYFSIEGGSRAGMYSQAYTVGADDLPEALTGELTEVRQVTKYVPVVPVGQTTTTTESHKEDNMATIQIEESEASELREKAGRVPVLETERDTEKARADAAEQKLAESQARTTAEAHARKRLTDANAGLAAPVVDRIVAETLRELPMTDEHKLDESKLNERIDAARTAEESYLAGLAEAAGAGTIKGFGKTETNTTEAELREANDKQRAGIFGRTIKEA